MFETSSFLMPDWLEIAAFAAVAVAGYLAAKWKWKRRVAALQSQIAMMEIELIKCHQEIEWQNPPMHRQVLQTDNLKVIDGIDRRLESLFYKAGIRTYQKLSETPIEKLRQLAIVSGSRGFSQRHPDDWPGKAQEIIQTSSGYTPGMLTVDVQYQTNRKKAPLNIANEK